MLIIKLKKNNPSVNANKDRKSKDSYALSLHFQPLLAFIEYQIPTSDLIYNRTFKENKLGISFRRKFHSFLGVF